jgi:alkylation response protein AidB-like acyl-CoA dehydrogenase
VALTAAQVADQKKKAEEDMLGSVAHLGFAKSLFFGRFRGELLFPYPVLAPEKAQVADEAAAKVRQFADAHIDHLQIDRDGRIPDAVIKGLADLGVYKMTIPVEYGGLGFGQQQYLRTMEILGGHCASTAVFVNAHHSIGCRALVLFGTKAQQEKWLPGLLDGTKLCAFALTEPEAGSDAGNVQTTATPTADGSHYVLDGTKHYITNGGIADILTVAARTPDGNGGSKVTCFLVTPDLPGFEVVEARADKCGIRGTATGKLRFTGMRVPAENVLGPVGKGLRVALTVLDFGRVTFGASCTGHGKVCLKAMVAHAKGRTQFQQPLADFQLVQKKVAWAAAHVYAMEAATTEAAAFIDQGHEDYMLETGMLKVFATEHLWTIVYDTLQVYGGKGYFTDQPVERWMRDARINTIGEGANEVLKSYLVAAAGCKAPGEFYKGLRDDLLGFKWTVGKLTAGVGVGSRLLVPALAETPTVPVKSPALFPAARRLATLTKRFGTTLPNVFLKLKTDEGFFNAQLVHERIADIAIDLYVSACVLARLDHENPTAAAGRYFLDLAARRIEGNFTALASNDDDACLAAAAAALAG